jgi:hypothetical protein
MLMRSDTTQSILQNVHRSVTDDKLGVWEVFGVAVVIVVHVAQHDEIDVRRAQSASFQLCGDTGWQSMGRSAVDVALQVFGVTLFGASETEIEHHAKGFGWVCAER